MSGTVLEVGAVLGECRLVAEVARLVAEVARRAADRAGTTSRWEGGQ